METAAVMNSSQPTPRPGFDVVVTAPGSDLSETTVRAIARRHRAKLCSLVKRGPQRADLRMETSSVYDLVIALEAVGMEVVRVVASNR